MKDKTIKTSHYDYANSLIQIFGFANLADFDAKISYEYLKQNETQILESVNATLDEFKELFPQNNFDLRQSCNAPLNPF